MESQNRTFWPEWARLLQRWGIEDLASFILEAVGPLAFIGAQAIYMGQPFLGRSDSNGKLQALAELLEDQQSIKDFTAFLREDEL